MNITYHAGQRFLERVINKVDFSKYEVHKTVDYLQIVFQNIIPSSYTSYLPLPGFENKYYAVFKENTIITIIPKDKKRQFKRIKNA